MIKNIFKGWLGGVLGGFIAVGTCIGLVAANAPGARLASGKFWVGNASGVAVPVSMSSDATMDNTGAVTLSGSSVASAEIAANTIVSADIDKNVIQVANLQITNAQALALRATPLAITSVPAAGNAFVVDLVEVVSIDTAGAWTETSDDLMIEYSGGVDIVGLEAGALVGGAAHILYYYPRQVPIIALGANTACSTTCVGSGECMFGQNTGGNFVACSDAAADMCICGGTGLIPTAAEAIQVKNIGDGEWGGGNAADTISIRLWYHMVQTAAFSSGG